MIAEFICLDCKREFEEYFHTYRHMKMDLDDKKIACFHCSSYEIRRIFGKPHVGHGTVSGYEKENADNLTIGKAFDSKNSKWV